MEAACFNPHQDAMIGLPTRPKPPRLPPLIQFFVIDVDRKQKPTQRLFSSVVVRQNIQSGASGKVQRYVTDIDYRQIAQSTVLGEERTWMLQAALKMNVWLGLGCLYSGSFAVAHLEGEVKLRRSKCHPARPPLRGIYVSFVRSHDLCTYFLAKRIIKRVVLLAGRDASRHPRAESCQAQLNALSILNSDL